MKKTKKQRSVRPRWTKGEVAKLRRMYKSSSNAEIARALERKVSSIVFKGYRLGLSKGVKRLKAMGKENIAFRWGERGKAKARRN